MWLFVHLKIVVDVLQRCDILIIRRLLFNGGFQMADFIYKCRNGKVIEFCGPICYWPIEKIDGMVHRANDFSNSNPLSRSILKAVYLLRSDCLEKSKIVIGRMSMEGRRAAVLLAYHEHRNHLLNGFSPIKKVVDNLS